MKKFIKLILFSTMLLLLTVGCGISSEDIDATVEARIATVEAKVEARIASMATPTPLPPTATPNVVFATATPIVVIVTPTPTPIPSTNLTGGEAEDLVRMRLERQLRDYGRSSCGRFVYHPGTLWGSDGKWERKYIPEDKIWEITFISWKSYDWGAQRITTPLGQRFTWLVYERTQMIIPTFSFGDVVC